MAVSVEAIVHVHGCKFCEQCYRNANSPVGMALQSISGMGIPNLVVWQNDLIVTETLCTNLDVLLRGQSYAPYFKSRVYNFTCSWRYAVNTGKARKILVKLKWMHVNCKRSDFLLPYMVNEQWSEDKEDEESTHYHTLPHTTTEKEMAVIGEQQHGNWQQEYKQTLVGSL